MRGFHSPSSDSGFLRAIARCGLVTKSQRIVVVVATTALSLGAVGWLGTGPAYAASDGSGTMSVSTSPASTVAGTNTNQLSFTFNDNVSGQFNTNSIVTITVPSTWTAPSTNSSNPGYVSASGSCSSLDTTPSVSGSGPWTITIGHRCNNGQSFTVVYGANSGSTHVTAPTTAGSTTFNAASQDGSSGLAPLSASPSVTVVAAGVSNLAYGQQPTNVNAGATMSPAVTVTARDAFNNLVSGATVALSSVTAGGSAVTNASGVATFGSIVINTAGTGLRLTATSGSGSQLSNTFNVSALAANKLGFIQGPTTVAAGAAMAPAVTVQVQDQFGNPVASNGVPITLAPSSGVISSGNTANTVSTGLATFNSIKINAAATGLSLTATSTTPALTSVASNTFNVTAGTPGSVAFVQQPSNVAAGVNMAPSVTVQVNDAFGNPVSGASVGLTPSSGTIASGSPQSTNAAGLATFSAIKINTIATGLTLTATAGSVTSAASTAFNVGAGPASKLGFVQQPSNVTAGVAMTPGVTVQVQDQFGNAVAVNGLNITLAPTGGTITSGNTATTDSTGLATFSAITINSAAASMTVTASSTSPSYTSGASSAFVVSAAAANKLAFVQQPTNVLAGVSIAPSVTVQVQDQFGNPVSSNGVSITLTPSSGTIASGSPVSTGATGLATFSAIKINTVATGLTLTASSTTPALTSGPSTSFNVTAGAASKFVIQQQPSNVFAGTNMSPAVTVQVQDAFGNPVLTDSGRLVTLVLSSGTIASGNTANTASGIATFSTIKINTAATGLTLTATGNITSSTASSSFNVAAANASKLAFVQQPSNVQAGVDMAPAVTVQVQDPFGNPVLTDTGRTVTVAPSSGTIASGNSAVTSGGLATFNSIKIDAAATGLTLTASASLFASSVPSSAFNVSGGVADKLAFVQQPSDASVGAAMTPPVTVQVQDQFGNASPTAANITLTPSLGSISAVGSTTAAASGLATFTGLTIDTANTGITLIASSGSLTASSPSISFNVTVAVSNGAALTDTATDAGSGVASVSYYYCAGYTGACTSGTLIGTSTDAGADFPVAWNGQPGDGAYRLVSVGIDRVTNTSTVSASIPVTVSNVDHFIVSAPASTTPGAAFTVTVSAVTAANAVIPGYRGTIHFTSSDGAAVLPANYTFTAGDSGVHTFTNATTLATNGVRSISVNDTVFTSKTGTTNVTVAGVPGAPTVTTVTTSVLCFLTICTATVNFTAPASNGGSAITGYTATCVSSNGGNNPTAATGGPTATSIVVGGSGNYLTDNKLYTCSVTASNANGTGPPGTSAQFSA